MNWPNYLLHRITRSRSYTFILSNAQTLILTPFKTSGAVSRYPLYLLGHGLRFAPPATQKDAASIGAKIPGYDGFGSPRTLGLH